MPLQAILLGFKLFIATPLRGCGLYLILHESQYKTLLCGHIVHAIGYRQFCSMLVNISSILNVAITLNCHYEQSGQTCECLVFNDNCGIAVY